MKNDAENLKWATEEVTKINSEENINLPQYVIDDVAMAFAAAISAGQDYEEAVRAHHKE